MEEWHHIDHGELFERAHDKYSGKSAKWLCDKLARLSGQFDALDKNASEKIEECSVALMERLKHLTEEEIELLKGYVYDKYEENKDYLTAKNVFSLKEIFGL